MKWDHSSTAPVSSGFFVAPFRPITLPSAFAVKSTQISLESTVPCEKWWPMFSVRTTVSIRYDLPGCNSGSCGRTTVKDSSSTVPSGL